MPTKKTTSTKKTANTAAGGHSEKEKYIELLGVETHNLKNVDVKIPRNKFTVITGVSGSGKSSLAFTTLCAEGQRRYLESLSTYARMFIGGMKEEAKVREVSGITPTISIDQKTVSHNPRSTVGTITEIYDFLRLLFLHLGTQYCPNDGEELKKHTKDDIRQYIETLPEKAKFCVFVPLLEDFETMENLKKYVASHGFVRYSVGGKMYSISDEVEGDLPEDETGWIVIDRLIKADYNDDHSALKRLYDSLDLAFERGEDRLAIYTLEDENIERFSRSDSCQLCGYTPEKLTLSHFSFNSPIGACKECHGLGHRVAFVPDNIVDSAATVEDGALKPWNGNGYYHEFSLRVCEKYGIAKDVPFSELAKKHQEILLYGAPDTFRMTYTFGNEERSTNAKFKGVITWLEGKHAEGENMANYAKELVNQYAQMTTCPSCEGFRVGEQARRVLINGKHIGHITDMSVLEALDWFDNLDLNTTHNHIADKILKNVRDRLTFLRRVGLGYITLSRRSNTLSGGEGQRIRLATQVGSRLEGITYVLDEPSIGLHPRDNDLLIENLKELTGIGNTLIVVEHDSEIMYEADEILDIGPGAGIHGGEVVFQGTYDELLKTKSVTGEYLSNKRVIEIPENTEKPTSFIEMRGASMNNLKNVDAQLPLERFTVVTGVSGSGKSSLINKTLSPFLANKLNRASREVGPIEGIDGWKQLDKAIVIDQMPIGKTPRSNPATYTGVFTNIREVFAQTVEAKKRGYGPGHFSFNTKQGRCEACEGDGVKKIEMHFMPDMHVTCETCNGSRYNAQVDEILYRGKSISEVLDMTVEEAHDFFEKFPRIKNILGTLCDVGLNYIKLGQSATTLSGGESQRVKLATELAKRSTSKTIYILDEPTTGLHFSDIQKLLNILHALVEKGNTVVVIEHNLDFIANAHWILDIGPEGGDGGGEVLYSGLREGLLKVKGSHTAASLEKFLARRSEG